MRELQRNLMALEYLLLKWMPPYTQIWPLNTMYMAFQRYFSMYVYVPSELKAPHNTIEATTTFLKDCLENLCFCIIRACKTFGKKCCSHAKFFVKFVCVGCMDNFCFFAASVVMCESHIIASGNRSIDTCRIKHAGQPYNVTGSYHILHNTAYPTGQKFSCNEYKFCYFANGKYAKFKFRFIILFYLEMSR